MEKNIIGRKEERRILLSLSKSKQSEFAVVYGRRRVGKTYLVRELFEGKFAFYHTAISPFDMSDSELLYRQQLKAFSESLRMYGDYHNEVPSDWFEAFSWLKELLIRKGNSGRHIVFIDELPWMDTPRAGFIAAFEHFWNGWGAGCHNLFLIVCGSATTWINDKILNNTGGLYGRATREIHLSPFNLSETYEYFKSRGLSIDRYDTLHAYMVVGGIPYYLSYFEKGLSVAQNIDNMFFKKDSKLQVEFIRLYQSLFKDSEKYMGIVKFLATKRIGFTRKEICSSLGISSGAGITALLQSLEASDFIIKYIPTGGSVRDARYKLIDFFTLFYCNFADKVKVSTGFWENSLHNPQLNAWRGFAFEEVCYAHQDKIKSALGISGINANISPWISNEKDSNTQIDMVIDRDDRVVNICEIKFYNGVFSITKQYDLELRDKVTAFTEQSKKRKNPHLTIITTYGLKQNMYSGSVQRVITMEDLF
ncbi:MAG: ATP-binding protein [Muribaculaceae bacterium]